MLAFKSEGKIMQKALCFQDSKVLHLVSEICRKPSIISRKPLKVSKLNLSLDPPNFQELRVEFSEPSFEGLSPLTGTVHQ